MISGKLWGGLVVLFFAGALTGIAGTTLYHQYEQEHRWERGPAAKYERIMKRLTHDLALTPAQQADIEPIDQPDSCGNPTIAIFASAGSRTGSDPREWPR